LALLNARRESVRDHSYFKARDLGLFLHSFPTMNDRFAFIADEQAIDLQE